MFEYLFVNQDYEIDKEMPLSQRNLNLKFKPLLLLTLNNGHAQYYW